MNINVVVYDRGTSDKDPDHCRIYYKNVCQKNDT